MIPRALRLREAQVVAQRQNASAILLRMAGPVLNLALTLLLAATLETGAFAKIGIAFLILSTLNFAGSGMAIRILGSSTAALEDAASAFREALAEVYLAALLNASVSFVAGTILIYTMTGVPWLDAGLIASSTVVTQVMLILLTFYRMTGRPATGLVLADPCRYGLTTAVIVVASLVGVSMTIRQVALLLLGGGLLALGLLGVGVGRGGGWPDLLASFATARRAIAPTERAVFAAASYAGLVTLSFRMDLVGLSIVDPEPAVVGAYAIAARLLDGANLCFAAPEFVFLPRVVGAWKSDRELAQRMARRASLLALALLVLFASTAGVAVVWGSPAEMRSTVATIAAIFAVGAVAHSAGGFNASLPLTVDRSANLLRLTLLHVGLTATAMLALASVFSTVEIVATVVAATTVIFQVAQSRLARQNLRMRTGIL